MAIGIALKEGDFDSSHKSMGIRSGILADSPLFLQQKLNQTKSMGFMSNYIDLHPFVSRADSLAAKISDKGEDLGFESFFSEKVPFDSVTCYSVASQIVRSTIFLANKMAIPSHENIHIYEFGAGLGILASHVLMAMKNEFPEYYARLILHISDISASKLDDLKQHSGLALHGDRVCYEVCDLAQPVFADNAKPVLVYHSYLFAALPVRHLVLCGEDIHEVVVKTSLPKNICVVTNEMTQGVFNNKQDHQNIYPCPVNLNAHQVADILMEELDQDDLQHTPYFYRQIRPHLKETFLLQRLSDSDIEEAEVHAIKRYVDYVQPEQDVFFNYHHGVVQSTLKIIDALPAGAAYLSIDTGQNALIHSPICSELLSIYGVYTYYPFTFKTMQHCAEQKYCGYVSKEPYGDSRGNTLGLIYKPVHGSSNNADSNKECQHFFEDCFAKGDAGFYSSLKQQLLNLNQYTEFAHLDESLDASYKTYTYWMYFARAAKLKKQYQFAIGALDKAIALSLDTSSTAKILKAQCLTHLNLTAESIALYKQLFLQCCYEKEVLLSLLMHYFQHQQDDQFMQVVQIYFELGYKEELNTVLLMGLKILSNNNSQAAVQKWLQMV